MEILGKKMQYSDQWWINNKCCFDCKNVIYVKNIVFYLESF